MGSTVPGMTEIGTDWRVVDGVATAWFDAPSLIEGAALAGRIVELSADIVVDLRATGMRVRLDSDEHAATVSAAARDLGLAANPAVQSSTLRRRSGAGSATASTSSSLCRRTSRRRASPRSSRPVAGSLTSRRIVGGSPTRRATKW